MKRTFTFLSVATAFCVIAAIAATVIMPSCKSSKSTAASNSTPITVPDKPSYAVHVKPIVDAACNLL